jgi:two-component system, NtrC family, sensor kinase
MKHNAKEGVSAVKISLATKMVIYVTALLCITISFLTYLNVKNESSILTQYMIQMAKGQAMHIGSSTEEAFWSLNWIYIEKMLQKIREDNPDEIVFVKLAKPNGEVYLADSRAYYGEKTIPSLLFKEETIINNYYLEKNQGNGKLLIHPIKIGEEAWYVLMGLSSKPVEQAIRALIMGNIAWGILILLVVATLSFFLSKSISNPLKALAHSAMEIAKGNLGQKIIVKSKDEVGLFSHAFYKMIENLEATLKKLAKSEKAARAIIDAASMAKIGIAVVEKNGAQKGTIKYANHEIAELTKYGTDRLLGKSVNDIIHLKGVKSFMELYNVDDAGISINISQDAYQFFVTNNKGEKIPIEINVGATSFENSDALVFYVKDIREKLKAEEVLKRYNENLESMVMERTKKLQQVISDLKKTRSQLLISEKLASIGQLAAGIAHEINTPIQYLGDNTRFVQDAYNNIFSLFNKYESLSRALKGGLPIDKYMEDLKKANEECDITYLMTEIPVAIEQSLEGVERVSVIVRSMKEFSHPGVKEKTAVDINHSIESTVTVAKNEWKYVAGMEMDLDTSLPPILCLPGELNQVLLNIVINGAQAISQVVGDGSSAKGTIRISTHKDGDYVEIRIRDTGPGIPKEIQSSIFDPFFTTKEVGKGTGQGLAIAHSVIVEKHGGDITFETIAGKGTTFIIRLPIQQEER